MDSQIRIGIDQVWSAPFITKNSNVDRFLRNEDSRMLLLGRNGIIDVTIMDYSYIINDKMVKNQRVQVNILWHVIFKWCGTFMWHFMWHMCWHLNLESLTFWILSNWSGFNKIWICCIIRRKVSWREIVSRKVFKLTISSSACMWGEYGVFAINKWRLNNFFCRIWWSHLSTN